MKRAKLILYNIGDIEEKQLVHSNAFIKPDGTFYLAKGYTGCNPALQLESSASAISRLEIAYDIRAEYNDLLDGLITGKNCSDEKLIRRFYYLRTILVHYYGYALFARKEFIRTNNDRGRFIDVSLIPNPEYYGKEITKDQIETLTRLFQINDDETFLPSRDLKSSDECLKLVLSHANNTYWHR